MHNNNYYQSPEQLDQQEQILLEAAEAEKQLNQGYGMEDEQEYPENMT